MHSTSRQLISIVTELCAARGIHMTRFSDDWILRLEKNGRVSHVIGYDFDINPAAARMIAKDKAATTMILSHAGVPVVDHRLFHAPAMAAYVPPAGNWPAMLRYLEDHGARIVCKPNEGTGGTDVHRITSVVQLEAAVQKIFQRHRSLCLSPLIDDAREIRVVVIDGTCEVAYEKLRPFVEGDGISTIAELAARGDEAVRAALDARGRGTSDADRIAWDMVPATGERILLSWRHNLGKGATSHLLADSDPAHAVVTRLAMQACEALGLRAASVDIFVTPDAHRVLEVNAGIMMENLSAQGESARGIAQRIYGRMLDAVLA